VSRTNHIGVSFFENIVLGVCATDQSRKHIRRPSRGRCPRFVRCRETNKKIRITAKNVAILEIPDDVSRIRYCYEKKKMTRARRPISWAARANGKDTISENTRRVNGAGERHAYASGTTFERVSGHVEASETRTVLSRTEKFYGTVAEPFEYPVRFPLDGSTHFVGPVYVTSSYFSRQIRNNRTLLRWRRSNNRRIRINRAVPTYPLERYNVETVVGFIFISVHARRTVVFASRLVRESPNNHHPKAVFVFGRPLERELKASLDDDVFGRNVREIGRFFRSFNERILVANRVPP